MTITFVSNYINHHQIPFCEAMYKRLGDKFCFIQTEPMEEERIKMGWGVDESTLPYWTAFEREKEICKRKILESDIVVFGGVENESYIDGRLRAARSDGKITMRYSERIYKTGQWKFITPRGLIKKYHDHIRYRGANVFMLCSGAYVASDFNLIRAYPNKKFCWGYFPKFIEYETDKLFKKKDSKQTPLILWAGRFLNWKHPETALETALMLKKEGFKFRMLLIGNGEMSVLIHAFIERYGLSDVVECKDFMKPAKVRKIMEESDIFLLNSDRREGWGAVVNEAMNSALAVVAGYAAGAVPFMIRHGENGFMYKSGDAAHCFRYVKMLLEKPELRKNIGTAAYETVKNVWNADYAAERLIELTDRLQNGHGVEQKDVPLLNLGAHMGFLKPGEPAPILSIRGVGRSIKRIEKAKGWTD